MQLFKKINFGAIATGCNARYHWLNCGLRFGMLGLMLLFTVGVSATEIPWRLEEWTLTARNMPVREALETFAVSEGIPIVISPGVKGTVSGNFNKVKASDFLNQVATINNLTWYYDGASLWVYGSGETTSTLLDLRYMKADEVVDLMRQLGVEDDRFPLKRASDDEMIMVSGPERYVMLVVEMINKADRLREQRTFTKLETRIFPLKYTWADNVSFQSGSVGAESSVSIKGVAYLLQEIMRDMGVGMQETTNEYDRAATSRPQPIIRPENRMNAVLVRDAETRMPLYEKLIKQLDHPQKLVEIGVTVLELSRDDALDWQMSLGIGGSRERSSETHSAGTGMNIDNLMTPDSLSGLGSSGAYSYLGKHVNINASLSALKSKGKARNISRTSLLTLNNMTAEISDTESYSTKLIGEKVASVNETSAGTRLAIKPRVVDPPFGSTNLTRQIWLSLELQDGGLDMLSLVDSLPTKRTTRLETQASLPEGESLLLAGYFKDIDEDSGWGIPYLRDIPWIGWLFGGHSQTKTTVQRMFILTPHVVEPFFNENGYTQKVSEVQMLRQRDVSEIEAMADAVDRDDMARKEREADLEEKHDIRHERFEDIYKHNEEERDFREEQRDDAREGYHKAWKEDLRIRREAYRNQQLQKELDEMKKEQELVPTSADAEVAPAENKAEQPVVADKQEKPAEAVNEVVADAEKKEAPVAETKVEPKTDDISEDFLQALEDDIRAKEQAKKE